MGWTLGPFAYVASYASLRYLYKRIFRREPTYSRGSWYDWEEGRRQGGSMWPCILPMMTDLFPQATGGPGQARCRYGISSFGGPPVNTSLHPTNRPISRTGSTALVCWMLGPATHTVL